MGKWQMGIIGVFVVVYCVTVLITGHATWILAGIILAALLLAYSTLNVWISRRAINRRHDGDREAAMGDELDGIPASHLIPDDDTGAGDTPEVHAEVNAHDFPLYSPVRHTVLAQSRGGIHGTTRGTEGGAARHEQKPEGEDRTAERSGEQQRGAEATA